MVIISLVIFLFITILMRRQLLSFFETFLAKFHLVIRKIGMSWTWDIISLFGKRVTVVVSRLPMAMSM